jgi:hypothetical protein
MKSPSRVARRPVIGAPKGRNVPTKKLFAWANPAFVTGAPVDHTWVTSYDNNAAPYPDIVAVVTAQEDYWFCWGSFHAQGRTPTIPSGSLGLQVGDINIARCLVASNADSATSFAARGTIFSYGIDGVCHQLANQVLFATRTSSTSPLTVAKAAGYPLSLAIYGTYGLQHAAWSAKRAACVASVLRVGPRPPTTVVSAMDTNGPSDPRDEFAEHVIKALGPKKMHLASKLLNLRAQFQTAAATDAHTMTTPTAADLNARNQRFFDEAAKILAPNDYYEIFGVKPGAKVNLVLENPSQISK